MPVTVRLSSFAFLPQDAFRINITPKFTTNPNNVTAGSAIGSIELVVLLATPKGDVEPNDENGVFLT
jgi:hypothetical protein